MASQIQIHANRKNAQKSTGPRSAEGKASPRSNCPSQPEQALSADLLERGKSRFNALKSGLHAQSQVIPGEDAADLEALAASYREQFQPESPQNAVLMNSLIAADWQLRRLRKIEAQLWQRELTDTNASAAADLAEAYSRNKVLDQVQRRIQTTERSYRQTLKQIRLIQKEDREAQAKQAYVKKAQKIIDNARAEARARVRADAARQVKAEMGSFPPGEEDAGYPPDPEDTDPK